MNLRVSLVLILLPLASCGSKPIAELRSDFRSAKESCISKIAESLELVDAALVKSSDLKKILGTDHAGNLPSNITEDVERLTSELEENRNELRVSRGEVSRVDSHSITSKAQLKKETESMRTCYERYFDRITIRELNDLHSRVKTTIESKQNADQMAEINHIKGQLRKRASEVFSTTDGYGATVQLFHMPNGETVECTTDFTGGSPLFWCKDAAHKKYLK